jgi:hypothetical protein
MLDGAPIVAIATGLRRPSANAKTGAMVQTWILRADVNPLAAIHSGADASVCGACPLRGILDSGNGATVNRCRACYVATHQAPLAVFNAYRRGAYVAFDARQHLGLFRGRMLRLGAYGDPVATPYSVWSALCHVAAGHTGYTHRWRDGRFWRFRRLLMASVHTLDEARVARSRGWRTFRVAPAGEQPARGEFGCPTAAENGKRTTCERCGGCNGANGNQRRASVVIWAHGSPATLGSYRRLMGRD